MIKKCLGCGSLFQSSDPNKEGYISELNYDDSIICQRCFKIKNYGEYSLVLNNEQKYQEIFKGLTKKKDLILYVCDILDIDENIKKINSFDSPVILVITKKDLLPKSVKESKLLNHIKANYTLKLKDIIFVCSTKNYNLDLLINLINKYRTSKDVYLVGKTNAGKSTLINALIKTYSNNDSYITTSFFPATTQNIIKIKLDENIFLIDTPGLVDKNNFLYDEDAKVIKNVSSKKEIKPITYQMKPNESIIIGNYARIDYLSDTNNSFTLYLSNAIDVRRIKLNTNNILRNLEKRSFNLDENKDIVISGLGFCKITKKAKVDIYIKENVCVFERNNLI